jgi:hypothetical protein
MGDYKTGALKGTITFINSDDKSWDGPGGKIYYFTMKVKCPDGEIEGQVGFKTAEAKYKVGDTITFDKDVDAKGRIKFKTTKLAEDSNGPSGKGQTPSTYNDPVEIKHTALSMAQMCARLTYAKMNEGKELVDHIYPKSLKHMDAMALKYYTWIINIDPLTRDSVIRRAYCVQGALEMKNYVGIVIDETTTNISSSDDILKVAAHNFEQQQIIGTPLVEKDPF